jgi:anti-sigma B factor antagonist
MFAAESDNRAGPVPHPRAGPTPEAATATGVSPAGAPLQRAGRPWKPEQAVESANVRVCIAADHAEVAVAGELDLAAAPLINRTMRDLRAAGHKRLIVNLDDVTFMDWTAVATLIDAHREMTASGGTLELTPHPLCARLLKITGMTDVFTTALIEPAEPRQ